MRSLLKCLLIASFAIIAYGRVTPHIVGGKDAPKGAYPYQVSIRTLAGQHFCGGSIISRRTILTAGHCVVGKSANNIRIHVGTNSLKENGTVYKVQNVTLHEKYKTYELDDIALLITAVEIKFNKLVQPILLEYLPKIQLNETVVLTGWGYTKTSGPVSNNLQTLNLKIYDQKNCSKIYSKVKDSHVCTFSKKGEGACFGDSGSPVVARNAIQVGLASFVSPCALGYPDVHTRISFYTKWILKHVVL